MIHQDRQTAANQHHHKKEIEEVAVTHPDRKPMRPSEVVGLYLRNGWNMRQPGHGDFDPRRRDYREDRDTDSDQDGRSNPETKSAIRRIVDGSVCLIKRDHITSENCPVTPLRSGTAWFSMWAAGTSPKKIKRPQLMVRKPRKAASSIRRRKQRYLRQAADH